MKKNQFRLGIALVVLTFSQSLFAQYGNLTGEGQKGTVSGMGMIVLEKQPEIMRMQIEIQAKAGSLKEALVALKKQEETAKAQLAVLGANKKSIKIGSPTLSAATDSGQQQQMEMLMQARLRSRGGKTAKKKATTTPVVVKVSLIAEWKITAITAEELLLASHPLQKKIKDADLAGVKTTAKLTPEQQEILEELGDTSSMYSPYGNGNQTKPGEPVFSFVCAISEQEQEKALADAFQKAKAQAARVAKATGSQLGKLASVSSVSMGGGDDMSGYGNNYAIYQAYQQMTSGDQSQANPSEAVGMLPKKVTFRVSVTAGFELKTNTP